MTSYANLLKALLIPGRRKHYLGRFLTETAVGRPADFLAACHALRISSVEARYLQSYNVHLDVYGRSITEAVLASGQFQNELFATAKALGIVPTQLFVNVGANVGTTCLNAHAAGFRDIVAFEPVAANFDLLKRNLAQIEPETRLSLNRLALGNSDATARIHLNQTSSGRHSLVHDFGHETESIQMARLDHVTPKKPGLLWIDTEGYELEVLKGATEYLKSWATGVCLEITPELLGQDNLRELAAFLETYFLTFVSQDRLRRPNLLAIDAIANGKQTDVFCIDPIRSFAVGCRPTPNSSFASALKP